MKHTFLTAFLFACLLTGSLSAQTGYPLGEYVEASDGAQADAARWSRLKNKVHVSWASKDVHYRRHEVPFSRLTTDTALTVWRGERAAVEAVLFSPVATDERLRLVATDWKGRDAKRLADAATARFMGYVLTDSFRSCGVHPDTLPPFLVPDLIDADLPRRLEAQTTRPVWLSLEVPRDVAAGSYRLRLRVVGETSGRDYGALTLRLNVLARTLPAPRDYRFHLDFWQQPYAVARYHGVPQWSEAHFAALRPYLMRLARAGQKVATTILFYEPWGDQSHDKFEPMVQTVRRRDGSWTYDYTIFDRYVELLAACGIDRQINCYSMVPWDMSFRYFDEATGAYASLVTRTDSADYRELWTDFLQHFAAHLREKGWLEKTCIAMDERSLQSMDDAYRVAQTAVPGIRMALAGNYHAELVGRLHDYSVAFGQTFPQEEIAARRARGQVTTLYTCCADRGVNLLTNNAPADAAYLPVCCLARGFDGYLHWSWQNWAEQPLTDSRFRLFSPGDTYVIYPGDRSSVRFERTIEGIQLTEKVRLLREEYARTNREALSVLDTVVAGFTGHAAEKDGAAARAVQALERLVNRD